jgi:hypothetical protein
MLIRDGIDRSSEIGEALPLPRRLVQTPAADAMLGRMGYASELCIGVRISKPLDSHAWVEYEGGIVIGRLENLAEYAVLSAPARP